VLGPGFCAEALGNAGDLPQSEALAAKLDSLSPEDTMQQALYLPLIRSIIRRQKGDTAKAVALIAPVKQYPNGLLYLHRAQAYLAAGDNQTAAAEFGESHQSSGMAPMGSLYSAGATRTGARLRPARATTRRAEELTTISLPHGKTPTRISRSFVKPKPNTRNSESGHQFLCRLRKARWSGFSEAVGIAKLDSAFQPSTRAPK
jgi:hypothetical protein